MAIREEIIKLIELADSEPFGKKDKWKDVKKKAKRLNPFKNRVNEAGSSLDAEIEARRAPIGQKVIDQVRKNNPEIDKMERERLRKMNGEPEEWNSGTF